MPARGHNWLGNMNYNNGPYPKYHYSFDSSNLSNQGFGGGAGLTYNAVGNTTQNYGNYETWLSYGSKINTFNCGYWKMPNQSSGFNPFQKTYSMFVNFSTSESVQPFLFGIQASGEKIQQDVQTPFGGTTNIYPGIQCYLSAPGYADRFGTLNFVIQGKNFWAPIVYRSVVSQTDWGIKPDKWHLLTIAVDGNPNSFKQYKYSGYKVKIWIDNTLVANEDLCSEGQTNLESDVELPGSTDTIFIGTSPRNTTIPIYSPNIDYYIHSFSIYDYAFDQTSMNRVWNGLNHIKKWNENSQTWDIPSPSTWDANAATSKDMYFYKSDINDWLRIPANQSKVKAIS